MNTVRQIATVIVAREGGFVDDPDDPGGATKHGVTIHTLRRLGLDLTADGVVDTRDIRALTRDQAIDIFIRHYFERPGLSGLPEALQPSVFDMYVNAGANAILILQRLLCDMAYLVEIDGVLGPQTQAAVQSAYDTAPHSMVDAYGIARRNFYFRLADHRPASRKYARTRAGGKGGRITRAEDFITPKYHLTQQDFDKRIAA